MRGGKNNSASAAMFGHHMRKAGKRSGIQPVAGFIQQPDIGPARDDAGKGCALALAGGKHPHRNRPKVIDVHCGQSARGIIRRAAVQLRPEMKRARQRQCGIERGIFIGQADTSRPRDCACTRLQQCGSKPQKAGFSCAVRPSDQPRIPGVQCEAQSFEEQTSSAQTGHIIELKAWGVHCARSSSACISASDSPK